MSEKKNDISLVDIYTEIKGMRAESKRQYQNAQFFAGFAIGAAVVLLGASIWAATLVPFWQIINAGAIALIGLVFMRYCFLKLRRL